MKKVIAALAVGAAVLACGVAEAKDWKKVRIGTEGAYAPWNATDASGKLVGFEIDLANDLCKRMKVECEFVAQDWDGIIPALQQGKYDAIISAMTITDERQKILAFSIPYGTEPSSFVTNKNSPLAAMPKTESLDVGTAPGKKAIEDLAKALNGKTIGVQTSTTQAAFLEKHLPKVAVRTYDKIDNAGIDMEAGRVDAVIGDRSVVEEIIKNDKSGNIVMFGPSLVRGVLGEGVGVGLRKKDTDLKALFDKAIAEANKDGTIAKLSNQHFGYDLSTK
ncbi:MAG TPA: lysine/arginine/ornithine ABC transporter substrate-binding protein [Azospirillum sp.]|nr:lysine/arginine/ornithine ABC transporter substrate-binding protein [Azospirillum sp.]